MTRTKFTVAFMLVCLAVLLALNYAEMLDYVGRFSFVVILLAYTIGQYSTKFPKEND